MILSCWRFNQKKNIGFTIIICFYLGFKKNVTYKKAVDIFLTNILFEKMKAHLWNNSKIDLIGNYVEVTDNKALFVLFQVKKHIARKGLLGLSAFKKI